MARTQGRRVERLTLDNLSLLPGRCGSCVFWEHGPVTRARLCGHEAEEKAAWVSEVLREWGSCGRVVYDEDQLVGHLIWAPAFYVPGADGFATSPVSNDAVVLTTAYVDPAYRGRGLARMLIQAMAGDVLRHGGIRAVEAFGENDPVAREGHQDGSAAGHSCVLPTAFLLAVGFKTHRAHPRHPRMRMDLRTTLRWREELESALSKLRGAVAAAPTPVRQTAPPLARRDPPPAKP